MVTRTRALKIAVTCTALVCALGGLMLTTLAEGTEYYLHVDEVLDNRNAWADKRLQVHGFVSELRQRPDSLDYKFNVQFNGRTISATYTGIVPDTFRNESEVVLKGKLHGEGFAVEPDGVMAKCPSKYSPQTASPGR
jgi:cytochrome c-type biogenesis protein CcmE